MPALHRRTHRSLVKRLIKNRSSLRIALLPMAALIVVGGTAAAPPGGEIVSSSGPRGGLIRAGRVDPVNGSPAWYRDSNGVDLEGCMSALAPNCGAVPVPAPTQPPSFPGNF